MSRETKPQHNGATFVGHGHRRVNEQGVSVGEYTARIKPGAVRPGERWQCLDIVPVTALRLWDKFLWQPLDKDEFVLQREWLPIEERTQSPHTLATGAVIANGKVLLCDKAKQVMIPTDRVFEDHSDDLPMPYCLDEDCCDPEEREQFLDARGGLDRATLEWARYCTTCLRPLLIAPHSTHCKEA